MTNHSSNSASSPLTRRSLMKASAAAAAFAALGTNFAHAAGSDKIKVGLVGLGGRGRGAAGNGQARTGQTDYCLRR